MDEALHLRENLSSVCKLLGTAFQWTKPKLNYKVSYLVDPCSGLRQSSAKIHRNETLLRKSTTNFLLDECSWNKPLSTLTIFWKRPFVDLRPPSRLVLGNIIGYRKRACKIKSKVMRCFLVHCVTDLTIQNRKKYFVSYFRIFIPVHMIHKKSNNY